MMRRSALRARSSAAATSAGARAAMQGKGSGLEGQDSFLLQGQQGRFACRTTTRWSRRRRKAGSMPPNRATVGVPRAAAT